MRNTLLFMVCLCVFPFSVSGQTTEFNYQGNLVDGGSPANGSYDFEFALYDSLSGGAQVGSTVSRSAVVVTNGTFAVKLDFGGQFPGANRFLEIRVRPTGQPGITVLSPRQQINSSPYSIKSLNAENAATATNASQLGGVTANEYVLTGDARLSDARNPLPGSANYIQNTLSQQATSNFNISGGGVIAGNLAIGTPGANARLHVVDTTNATATTAFFRNLGTGEAVRGQSTTTTGSLGGFGYGVFGVGNTGVEGATFGPGTPTASIAVFGHAESTTGSTYGVWGQTKSSSGIGVFGWAQSTTGNTIGVEGLSQSPSGAGVRGTGSIGVLGSSDAGTGVRGFTTSGTGLHGISSTGLAGRFDGRVWIQGAIGSALDVLPAGGQNLFLGGGNLTGSELKLTNSGTAHFSIYNSGNSSLTFANTSAILSANAPGSPLMSITSAGNVGIGTTGPGFRLHVNGETRTNTLSVDSYVANNGGPALCANTSNNRIALCTSSLRYKTNVRSFNDGLNLISRLRPIRFTWAEGGLEDIGLAAEGVNESEPLLAFRDSRGQVEGVKYDRIGVVLINAVKEQQAQIQQQQEQLKRQQEQIKHQEEQARQQRAAFAVQEQQLDALKKLVCRSNRRAAGCK